MTQDVKKYDWKAALDDRVDTFKSALPDDIDVTSFLAVCKEAAMRVNGLQECLQVNPASAFSAFLACARDGLIPDGRQASIDVRYSKTNGKQAAYMPMVRGIVERMHRSGNIKSINVRVVYEGDEFIPDLSEGGKITYIPKFESEKLTHAFCVIETTEGGVYREVMGAKDIAKRRGSASTDFVWRKWEGEMAKKTVLHNIAKKISLTADDRRLVEHVESFADLNRQVVESEPVPILLDISPDSEAIETVDISEADVVIAPDDWLNFLGDCSDPAEIVASWTAMNVTSDFRSLPQAKQKALSAATNAKVEEIQAGLAA